MNGPRAGPIPLFERLNVESQANCNRSCWFCPRTYDRSGKYLDAAGKRVLGRMPTGNILDLLDQARDMGFQGLVGFHHYSEPLLDRRNPMLAREARLRGLRPYLHTNGDVLRRSRRLSEEVQELYVRIVVGIYDYESDEELEREKAFWRKRLPNVKPEFSAIGRRGRSTADSMGIPKANVPPDPRMSLPDLTYPNGPCHRPLIRMIIQYDGTMAHCCEDTSGAFELGSVYESTMAALWYSDRHVRIVRDLLAGEREKYGLCRQCPLTPSGPRSDGERVLARPRKKRRDAPMAVS